MKNYFKVSEFRCPCGCGEDHVDYILRLILNNTREEYGLPLTINSGRRCESHNKHVGGKPTSSHLAGYAVDIACPSSERLRLVKVLLNNGITRIGIGQTFVHVDVDPGKKDAMWLY